MLRGNSQKAKRGQKGLSTNLGKRTTSNLPTKESNIKKKNKLTLPIPSKPSMKRNEKHIKHTITKRWRTRRIHTHTETKNKKPKQNKKKTNNKNNNKKQKTKTKSKTSQAPKIKKRYIFTLLGRKYVVLKLLSKYFDINKDKPLIDKILLSIWSASNMCSCIASIIAVICGINIYPI